MNNNNLSDLDQYCIYLISFQNLEFLPDLIKYLGLEGTAKFCSLFGGERIKVPTIEELNDSIFSFKLLKEKSLTKISWSKLQIKYKLNNRKLAILKNNFKIFEDKLSELLCKAIKNE